MNVVELENYWEYIGIIVACEDVSEMVGFLISITKIGN